MSVDDLFDGEVHDRLSAAAGHIAVDVDGEWLRLLDRLAHEDAEVAQLPTRRDPAVLLVRLAAVAAAIVLLVVVGRPVFQVTVTTARFVQELVGEGPPEAPPTTLVPPTTAAPEVVTTTTTPPPPPTTTAPPPPPPPPTTMPQAAAGTDLAHAPVPSDDEYRVTIRRVHNSINAAIGYGNLNFDALEGSDARLERLLGLQPRFDPRLRDTIGHLREAQRNKNREAASLAHTIIESIERELATDAQG